MKIFLTGLNCAGQPQAALKTLVKEHEMKVMLSGTEHAQPADGVQFVINERGGGRCTSCLEPLNMECRSLDSNRLSRERDNMKMMLSGWAVGTPTSGVEYLCQASRERVRT